jgi:hypothetical protein
MGGGSAILTFTFTPAIVGIGTTITDAKSNIPKIKFFILLPPKSITYVVLRNKYFYFSACSLAQPYVACN